MTDITPEFEEKIMRCVYKKGQSVNFFCNGNNTSPRAIYAVLKKHGVTINDKKRGWQKPEHKLSTLSG